MWLEEQSVITLSLDIGTFFGLTLLVVYYISDNGKTRMASCQMTPSKGGEPVAVKHIESGRLTTNFAITIAFKIPTG